MAEFTDVIPLISKGRAQADGDNRDMNYIFGIEASTGRLAADFEDTASGANHPVRGVAIIPVSTTAWHHAAVTYDGNEWRLYLDGVLDFSETEAGATPRFDSIQHAALATAITRRRQRLQRRRSDSLPASSKKLRIWNYARTQAQIQASMHQEITAASGLLGRWGMNEATGTTSTADSSGNLNTGNFSSPAPTWSAGYPFIADGRAPAPPTNVIATPGNQAISLSWYYQFRSRSRGLQRLPQHHQPGIDVHLADQWHDLVTSAGYDDTGSSTARPTTTSSPLSTSSEIASDPSSRGQRHPTTTEPSARRPTRGQTSPLHDQIRRPLPGSASRRWAAIRNR